jgi:hypothetical protein
MSVNSTELKDVNDLSCELRLELEAGFRKQKELLKTFENLTKQLYKTKSSQVITFCYNDYLFFPYLKILTSKGMY